MPESNELFFFLYRICTSVQNFKYNPMKDALFDVCLDVSLFCVLLRWDGYRGMNGKR